MSTRLTSDIRDRIARAATIASLKSRADQITAREHRLAGEAYEAVFTRAERTTAAMLPEGWVRLDGCLRFNAGGYDVTLDAGKPVPVPSARSGYCSRLGSLTGDLAERVQAHAKDKEAAREAERSAIRQLGAFLQSFRTVEKLRDAWPEGAEFYAPFLGPAAEKAGLPAVPVAEINRMLGLKAAEPATA